MKTIETPNSSNIKKVAYDEDSRVLTVTFKSGDSYEYSEVPEKVFAGFESAPSAGKYFYSEVKCKGYDYKKV